MTSFSAALMIFMCSNASAYLLLANSSCCLRRSSSTGFDMIADSVSRLRRRALSLLNCSWWRFRSSVSRCAASAECASRTPVVNPAMSTFIACAASVDATWTRGS